MMKTHGPAFMISALIHLGILLLVFTGASLLTRHEVREERLALNLQMFQPAAPLAAHLAASPEPPVPEAVPEPPAKALLKPVPKAVTEPLPEVAAEPPPKPIAAPTVPAKPVPRSKPMEKPKPPAPRTKPLVAPTASVQASATPPTEQPALPQVDQDLLRRVEDDYKNALRSAIESHKGYPRRAIRLHHEGDVVVKFTLRPNGDILIANIVESADSPLLNQAALQAVRQIDGQLPFPPEIQRSEWVFTIPINYSLR